MVIRSYPPKETLREHEQFTTLVPLHPPPAESRPDWEGCSLSHRHASQVSSPKGSGRGTLPWSGLQMSRLPWPPTDRFLY